MRVSGRQHPGPGAAGAQVTVTVMPTKGLAAVTQAAIDDVAGYFQRYAVVCCRCHLPSHSMAEASCVMWQEHTYKPQP